MADIIQGMFGASPSQIMQDRNATGYAQDLRAVQLDPMQQANLMLRQGGRAFGQSVLAPMLGVEDQELQKAQMAQQLASQFEMTTPEGVIQYAQALAQNGMPEFAQIAVTKAQGMQKTGLDIQQSRLNIDKTQQALTREEQLRAAIAAMPEGLTQDEKDQYYIDQYRKYGNPDQQARFAEMGMAARAKLAAEGGTGGPGSVGKSGAYRDVYGDVLSGTEMKPIRQEFETNQRLLNTLNQISAQDVKNAESFIDYTTSSTTVKNIAFDKTLKAQTKIAASQLMEQIASLPPGSASDADMRAAMKNFPGYTNPEALRDWVNETKKKLQFHLESSSEKFGWNPKVKSTGDITFKPKGSPVQSKASSSDDDLINKYLK